MTSTVEVKVAEYGVVLQSGCEPQLTNLKYSLKKRKRKHAASVILDLVL